MVRRQGALAHWRMVEALLTDHRGASLLCQRNTLYRKRVCSGLRNCAETKALK